MLLNLNFGILGHVDSGKTTLAKALSAIASTAAFDKNPQSQERGITLDLGFSALQTDAPDHLKAQFARLQFTFVDCPGHASLIRTIIGGAQIIDLMILVIDINKGIQTQTAECLVIGELTCKTMIIALNKIDSLKDKKEQIIEKMKKKLRNTLSGTVFSKAPIVAISALNAENLSTFIDVMKEQSYVPERNIAAPFLFAVDHCFAIKGQGTVCTGTVLQGKIKLNEDVEFPKLKLRKKVKSIQMFKESMQTATQGDRIGLCVTQFDPATFERGLICLPGYVSDVYAAILKFNSIKYFKGILKTKSNFHISCGYETVMANIHLFTSNAEDFDWANEYEYLSEIDSTNLELKNVFMLLEFDRPLQATPKSLVIGSKLDLDTHTSMCRLAFWGHLDNITRDQNYKESFLPNLKIFKEKIKCGNIQRIANENELIAANLFKKAGNNRQMFVGLKVKLTTGEEGVIEDTFGQTSKVKLRFTEPIPQETLDKIKNRNTSDDAVKVELKFKKYIFSKNNKIVQ